MQQQGRVISRVVNDPLTFVLDIELDEHGRLALLWVKVSPASGPIERFMLERAVLWAQVKLQRAAVDFETASDVLAALPMWSLPCVERSILMAVADWQALQINAPLNLGGRS